MAVYKTLDGQNIWDLSTLLYGNNSSTIKIIQDNPALVNVGKTVPAGTMVTYTVQNGNTIADFLKNSNIDPNTGTRIPGQGSGFSSGFAYNGFN